MLAWTTISGGLKVRLIALMEGTTITLALREIWLLVSCIWSCTLQHPTQAWLFSSHTPSALRLLRNLKRSQRTTNTFGISATTNMSRWPFPCHQAMCMVLFGPSMLQMVSQPGIAWVPCVILGMAWWQDPSTQLVAPLSLRATRYGWSLNMCPRWSKCQPPCCSMWPMPTFKTLWIGPLQHASRSLNPSLNRSLIDRCWTQVTHMWPLLSCCLWVQCGWPWSEMRLIIKLIYIDLPWFTLQLYREAVAADSVATANH